MTSFEPCADTMREFRDALGQFGTGVTVVTAQCPEGPVGMTANSFASVSLDPPLVLWSPALASLRYAHFEAASHYAIHVLRDDQAGLARRFARDAHAFEGLDWHKGEHDLPLIEGCLARFECRQEAAHEGGDHMILVGRVLRACIGAGAPLLFAQGRYGGFAPADATRAAQGTTPNAKAAPSSD